jgi:hypothetical protein
MRLMGCTSVHDLDSSWLTDQRSPLDSTLRR